MLPCVLYESLGVLAVQHYCHLSVPQEITTVQ